jgi:hypothetical protein
LIAAGQPEQAGAHLDIALAPAQDTGMCFYDAELLRLRAHTNTDLDARRADRETALELARRQGATLFELRAALDDFELRGQPVRGGLADVVSRFPIGSSWSGTRAGRGRLKLSNPHLGQLWARLAMAAPNCQEVGPPPVGIKGGGPLSDSCHLHPKGLTRRSVPCSNVFGGSRQRPIRQDDRPPVGVVCDLNRQGRHEYWPTFSCR